MSNSSSNVTSPSTSSRPSTNTLGTSMVKSGSNRSIFRDNKLSRSRQNTVGLDYFLGEDLSNRNIGSDYQEIQIRTLTKWVNAQLRQVDESITNIKTDLRDGKKLLKLLSVVASDPAPKPERMNMRIHQLANVAQALSFLERQVGSDSMPDIGNEAIVNGDDKKTLALIFFIMLKYQIQLVLTEHGEDYLHSLSELSERENGVKSQSADFNLSAPNTPIPLAAARKTTSQNSISDKLQHTSTTADAKMALLYWVRIQLEDYIAANIIPSIQDFSRSWRSGIAFCLLIHRHNPNYIPDLFSAHLSANLAEKATWYELLKLAFSLASQFMGVEAFLEPEDLVDVDYPHEPSVMMYVSEYYKIMSKFQRDEPIQEKRARAAKRKAAIVMATGGSIEGDEDQEEEPAACESPPPMPMNDKDPIVSSPPETPEPVPIPSTVRRRQTRLLKQRQSTLGKDEKAKIKADLNSKLMMQLTGYLPRGVHPTLDELLTIHDTVLSYIKLNTKTIDEIPEEFDSSQSVSEYVDALEIIEEHSENEAEHLETAKKARDILTSPPETADDTLIRLTDLQRSQVVKLYDILEKEWDQFIDLLKTTKEDLLSIERVLIDTEESAEKYESSAVLIEKQFNELLSKLSQISAESHPIEDPETSALEAYQEQVENFTSQFNAFEETEWAQFSKGSRQLSRAVQQATSTTYNRVYLLHDTLVSDFEKERQALKNFERSLHVVNSVHSVESELNEIQSMMDDTGKEKATTNQAIQILESKVANVRSTLYTVQQQYGDLFSADARLKDLFSSVQSKYETVNAWVDQVRVWFIEAERIRGWIEEHIQIINDRNENLVIDPLDKGFNPSEWTHAITTKIYEEHERLKNDIDRFNEDDMKRLRSHVRELTGTADHHLTPADASTIEITLSTLTILDRMINMLRKRSGLIDMLKMRIEWEALIEKAMAWCENKDNAIIGFIQDKARWKEQDSSAHQLKQLTEEVIQTLVSLENSIAEFDKGEFSAVLDAYQNMESLENNLPRHLEQRQEELELTFELVMKKCAFARKIVEQFLVISDVTAQYKKLKAEGGKLKSAMAHDTSSETNFDERVQTFKESSMHWVTTLVKRIPYPEVPEEIKELEEDNTTANQAIQSWMNDYATYLAELTEDVEELLFSHRQDLSLQQRASLVYDDVLRVTNWVEDRLRALEKFDSTIVEDAEVIDLEDEALNRLEKERDSIASKLEHLEEHDLKKVTESARNIEIEMDETNSLSIDRSTLVAGIEKLEQSLNELKTALMYRTKEIQVLKKRVVWETQWEEAHQAILDLAQQLWDFNVRFAQYDVENLKERRKSQETTAVEVSKEDLHDQLSVRVQDLQTNLALLASDTSFNELESAYSDYSSKIPEHIMEKQTQLKSENQDIQDLLSYNTDIMAQNDSIVSFLKDTQRIQMEVEELHNSVHVLKREASSSSKTATDLSTTTVTTESTMPEVSSAETQGQLVQQIHEALAEIADCQKRGESIHSIPGRNWFESAQGQTVIKSDDYNALVEAIVQKHLQTIADLKHSLEVLLDSYQQMDAMRLKLVECQIEAKEIQNIVDNLAKRIKKYHIDVTVVSFELKPESVSTCRSEITKLTEELDQLESGRIHALQHELSQLKQNNTKDLTSAIDNIKVACNHLSENVTRSLMFIQQAISTELLVLEVAEKRLKWGSDMLGGQSHIDSINNQLQQYIVKKNKCVAQQEALTKNQIDDLVKEHSGIGTMCLEFKENQLRSLSTDYESIKALFIKLPLTKSIPLHIEEQMDDMNRSLKKLEDALTWRSKELDYIQQRCDLEFNMEEAVLDLDSQRKEIALFVESKGRWNSNDDIRNEILEESEQQLENAKGRFQIYCDSTLSDIKQTYSKLEDISNSLKPGFMSEIHAKKIEQLTKLKNNVQADIHFAQDTIIQRKQVTGFVQKATDLEKEAESIRELFLSSSTDNNVECTKKLEEFRRKVKDIEDTSRNNILTPKRTNEAEIAMAIRVKDKTLQSVVQDIIDTRVSRLNELVQNLSTLLRSQEVFTRLQYMLKTFKKQISVCELWISSRRAILEKNVHVLDDDNLTLNVDLLRDAVSEAESIQTSMNANDNNFTLLCKYREKYIEIFDEQALLTDAEKEEKMAEFEDVCEDFERVSTAWQDLLSETREVASALTSALLPAEINYRVTSVLSSFTELLEDIRSVDEEAVTDQQLSKWQKTIDHLETKEYSGLHSELLDHKHNIDVDLMKSLMNKLDEAGEIVLEIRAVLATLYDVINANRLRKTHSENSELFHKSAETIISLVDKIQLGKFSIITDKKTPDERIQCYKDLTIAHREIKEKFLECQGLYDDLCSYYTGMRVQGVLYSVSDQVQENVESIWTAVQAKNSELSAFITRNSKWIDGCNELDIILVSLEAIRAEVDKYMTSNQLNLSTTRIQKYERQLLKIFLNLDELENTVRSSSDLSEDERNKSKFLERSQEIRDVGGDIQQKLNHRKMDKERIVLFDSFLNEIAKATKVCDDQISYIRQQSNTNPELKKLETIKNITNAYSAALSHVQDKYKEIKNKYDGTVTDQALKLVKTYHHPETEVNISKSNLEKSLKELKTLLKAETDYITFLKQLSYLMKLDKDVSRLITDLKATISRSYNGSKYTAKITRTRNIPELKDFIQRYESIDKNVHEFYQKCDDLKKDVSRRVSSTRLNAIAKNIEKRKEDMVKRWAEIKSSADDTRERLDILHKRQVVTSKLSEALKYVESLKERVETLQLSGKSISVEEQELNEIQEEIDVTLRKSAAEIDSLLKAINANLTLTSSVSETTLRNQRDKLAESIEELRELVQHRIKQAHTEGSITQFLGIIDQIDAEILALGKTVEETSTQNATLDGSKFNKADLQLLLKTLVNAFKKSEGSIEALLEQAKSESQKQFLDYNEKVAKRLKKVLSDWSNAKSSVAAREKELQACIKELNHEFFTKLAMAKSIPKDRRAKRGNKSKPTIHAPNPRPPSNFRSSTLSTEMKMSTLNNTLKRSKSPNNSSSIPSTKYIPDPKNELDVQLGQIVNESPYKMKVKMVPGEVGKYWFGEEHPRLVYCRILPSKMVMVRVGGGWQELSKFMKDHGHSDGLATKSDTGETQYLTVNTFKDPIDDAPSYSVTTRSGSPMGPAVGTPIIRRGSGVSSSLTNRSSNSSSTGYLEGERFIQTDEDGNQVSLKMVRADSSSKQPNYK